MFGIGLWQILLVLLLGMMGFWLWMLIECAVNEPTIMQRER